MEKILELPLEWLIIIGINFLFILIVLLIGLSNKSKLSKLKRKYYRFMNGSDNINIEEVLTNCLNKVNGVIESNKEIEMQINKIEKNICYCMQKIGVVRYNAFDNVGSNLSFSIALLDKSDDGIVISSLYSRESSSTYAKPLNGGKSSYALSVEELQAIDIARKNFSSKEKAFME